MGDFLIESEGSLEFAVNSEMTNAVMENMQDYLQLQKRIEEVDGDIFALFNERDIDRFDGTVVNEEVILKLEDVNKCLDVIGTTEDVEIEKFEEPNPKLREAFVAITIHNGVAFFKGAAYGSFRRIVELSDEMSVVPCGDLDARIVFIFKNLWSEHREMTAAELEEQRKKFGLNSEGEYDND